MSEMMAGLDWVAMCNDDCSETEIFFRAQNVVDALRRIAAFHDEQYRKTPNYDHLKRTLHGGFAKILTCEADAYDVAIMDALLDHSVKGHADD